MNTPLQIAIDGPVASGKGDIAARLAQKLNLLYIYTGAMYRALALMCIRSGTSCKDEKKVYALLQTISIDIDMPHAGSAYPYSVSVNHEDVTDKIITQEAAQGASDVGVLSMVRTWMVKRQQELAKGKRVVMEGRDIGLRVLPDAQMKIFLTATTEERAERRFHQWKERGIQTTYEKTLTDTKIRDLQDSTRTTDPLQKLSDAWEVDTTHMTQDTVVEMICQELTQRKLI